MFIQKNKKKYLANKEYNSLLANTKRMRGLNHFPCYIDMHTCTCNNILTTRWNHDLGITCDSQRMVGGCFFVVVYFNNSWTYWQIKKTFGCKLHTQTHTKKKPKKLDWSEKNASTGSTAELYNIHIKCCNKCSHGYLLKNLSMV